MEVLECAFSNHSVDIWLGAGRFWATVLTPPPDRMFHQGSAFPNDTKRSNSLQGPGDMLVAVEILSYSHSTYRKTTEMLTRVAGDTLCPRGILLPFLSQITIFVDC